MANLPNIIAIDQYGEIYHDLAPYPRKALLEHLDSKHAEKMYIDTKSGETKHIGYVIKQRWLRLYRISEWTSESNNSS